MKKHLYLSCILCCMAMVFTACSSDDDTNTNRSDSQNTNNAIGYELPAPKGGKSIIITHRGMLRDYNEQNKKLEPIQGVNYSVEWDTEKGAQRWSCYKLYTAINYSSKMNVPRYSAINDGSLSPSCQYPNDPDLPAEYRFQAGQDPYKSSGYDHGHICPSADRQRAVEGNYQTFYITNMQPQYNKFNAGIWSDMELQVRNWTAKFDTLYVCKGGTIDNENNILEYIFKNSHQNTRVNKNYIPVPRYFFMAILGRKGNTFTATGYWIDQSNYTNNTLKTYAVNIQQLEKETGIDFFHTLPDNIESQVENISYSQMIKDWY